MSIGTAPGKVILLGEHAVVYGTPAMAVPVSSVRARAEVVELPPHEPSVIHALDLGRVIVADRVSDGEASDGLLVSLSQRPQSFVGRSPEEAQPVACASFFPAHSGRPRGWAVGAAVAARPIIRAVAAHYQIEVACRPASRPLGL